MDKLTTQQIINAIDNADSESEEWEDVFSDVNIAGNSDDDLLILVAAANFLEEWSPGQTWTAHQFKTLLGKIGMWNSAEELGRIRAQEEVEDELITEQDYSKIGTENRWAAYSHHAPGQHIHPVPEKSGAIISIVDLHTVKDLVDD